MLLSAVESHMNKFPSVEAVSVQLDEILKFTDERSNISKDLKQCLLLLRMNVCSAKSELSQALKRANDAESKALALEARLNQPKKGSAAAVSKYTQTAAALFAEVCSTEPTGKRARGSPGDSPGRNENGCSVTASKPW